MLYTKSGDKGKTKIFGCNQSISKSSAIAEALGNLDEINSFLGIIKVRIGVTDFKILDIFFSEIIHKIQQNLFIIQAEIAGSGKTIDEKKVKELEKIINQAEKELPPIKSFFISGGAPDTNPKDLSGKELGAMFDFARTVARRAERRVVVVFEENKIKVGEHSLAYLNRLSSILYAFARLTSHKFGINEKSPDYK